MKTHRPISAAPSLIALLALAAGVHAATTELASAPLSGASTVQIFPNILFVLDDSGSMDDDAMPDWARGAPLHQGRNPGFNGVAYNPAVTYSPPVYFAADGSADTTTYPGQTSARTANWTSVINDGYRVQHKVAGVTGSTNLAAAAFYYVTVAGEYCTDKTLRDCVPASAPTATHPLPANLRWCNSQAEAYAATPSAGACRATQTDATYRYARMPEPHTSRLTINAGGTVTNLTVAGSELLSATATGAGPGELAIAIRNAINACSFRLVGNCQTVGYRATSAGSVVTISAPAATPNAPVLLPAGTISATTFGRSTTLGENQAPGDVQLKVITGSTATYPKAATRTDCGGTAIATCSYEQEMTNYANWWAYYHTRMQTMKTASSLSLSGIDQTRRVGYMTINNNSGSDFLNIQEFAPAQKKAWYDKLFAAVPTVDTYTPLRVALANAGYLYAGKYNGQTLNGVSVTDPVQYYCQKNNTILSTDGYWNQGAGFTLASRTTLVGDQDGNVDRPQFDGGAPQAYEIVSQVTRTSTTTQPTQRQKKTQQLQSNTSPLQISTNTVPQSSTQTLLARTTPLLMETSQLQARIRPLQQRTKNQPTRSDIISREWWSSTQQLEERTLTKWQSQLAYLMYRESILQTKISTLMTQTSKLQTRSYVLQAQTQPLLKTVTQMQKRTSSDSGITWTDWANVAECITQPSGISRIECQALPAAPPVADTTCTVITPVIDAPVIGESLRRRYLTGSSCAYGTASGWNTAVAACTTSARSSGGEGSTWVGPATECRYEGDGIYRDATQTCTAAARSTGPVFSVLTARDCQYVVDAAWAPATATCTPVAENNQNLSARRCQYSGFPATWSTAGASCTPQPEDRTNFTVLEARQCAYSGFPATWSFATTTCTVQLEDPNYAVAVARECGYLPPSGWQDTASCTLLPQSTSSPYTVVTATTACRQVWTNWAATNQACVANATTECQYAKASPPGPDASCPASALAADFTNPVAKVCVELVNLGPPQNVTQCVPDTNVPPRWVCNIGWTDWTDATGACTPLADQTECRYLPRRLASWQNVSSCTPVAGSAAPPFTELKDIECQYDQWTAQQNVASCSELPQSQSAPFTVGVASHCSYGTPNSWQSATGTCTVAGQTGNNFVGPKTECQYAAPTSFADDASCPGSAVAASQGSPYTVTVAKTCSTRWSDWQNTNGPCTADGTMTQCQYGPASGWVNASSCTPVAHSGGPVYPGAAQDCRMEPTNPPWQNVGSNDCTAGTVNGLTTSCQWVTPPPTAQFVADCGFEQTADASNGWVDIRCTTATQQRDVGLCTALEPVGCPADTSRPDLCKRTRCGMRSLGATPDTLADVAQYYYMTDLRTSTLGNCAPNGDTTRNVCQSPDVNDTAGLVQRMTTYTLGLGASGLMQYQDNYQQALQGDGSDFASIKWITTALPAQGICSWQQFGDCNWPTPADNAQTNIDDLWHAAVNGRGTYFSARDPSSLATGISSALASISTAQGSLAATTVTSPTLVAGDNGIYEVSFEVGVWAGDVVKRTVDGNTGAISTSTVWSAEEQLRRKMTSNNTLPPDEGQRTIYTYNPGGTDNLKAFAWNALSITEQGFFSRPYINDLTQFCTAGLTCLADPEKNTASGENLLKFLRGDPGHEGGVQNLLAFYRQRSSGGAGNLHRPLGDISGSEAVFVQKPHWSYVDQQYAEFKLANSARRSMVYVGANDGMLHAFDATTGEELWAYVPALVIPKLYKLADKNYPAQHQFSVDGTPSVGDICADTAANCATANNPNVWKTILVGGLNSGGRGYYALDITDPAHPKALWEFTNANLGYTYGNPVITKLKDGTWVVIVSSGYNNVTPGDGQGRLFILEAHTGNPITAINLDGTISTGVGDTTTPSGLGRISAWASFPDLNNTAERVYGGDLLGNLWRFDINGDIPVISNPRVYDALRMVTLVDAAGNPQPITAKPELGRVNNQAVVFIGTGKILGAVDFNPVNASPPLFQTQSFYAIKDSLTDTTLSNPRLSGTFNQWAPQAGTCPVNSSLCTAGKPTVTLSPLVVRQTGETDVQFDARRQAAQKQLVSDAFGTTNNGWFLDLPGDGERSNTDSSLVRGSIAFNTNRPLESGACIPRAVGYRYFLDYRTGNAVEGTDGIIGVKIADSLVTRVAVAVRTDERLVGLTRTEGGDVGTGGGAGGGGAGGGGGGGGGAGGGGTASQGPSTQTGEIPTPPPSDSARRISWRELSAD